MAEILKLSVLTKEYVKIAVKAKVAGAFVNPTTDTVQMAFVTSGAPTGGDWKAASWETDATTEPDTYFARCLVGGVGTGATAELAVGDYEIWIKITDTPEVPARPNGRLVMY